MSTYLITKAQIDEITHHLGTVSLDVDEFVKNMPPSDNGAQLMRRVQNVGNSVARLLQDLPTASQQA